MSGTTVYLATADLDQYQSLLYDLPRELLTEDMWTFDGTSKLGTWIPRPVYSDQPRLERPDIWRLVGAAVLVMDREVEQLLEPFVAMAGELLPLVVVGNTNELYILNILRDIDCVDPEGFAPDTLELYPLFLEHRLPESGLFKIPQVDTTQIFYVERDDDDDSLITRIERNALRGLTFEPVWSTEHGPEHVNLLAL